LSIFIVTSHHHKLGWKSRNNMVLKLKVWEGKEKMSTHVQESVYMQSFVTVERKERTAESRRQRRGRRCGIIARHEINIDDNDVRRGR